MWTVILSPKAEKQLFSLPDDIAQRIVEKLKEIKNDPKRYFERLKGRADYKLRIGDYRAIADLHEAENKIEVTKIGHRKSIYER